MSAAAPLDSSPTALDAHEAFYRDALERLNAAGVPFLVGGAYAFACYTAIERSTKDLDLFVCRADLGRVRDAMRGADCEFELTFPHWLAKVHAGAAFVDLMFGFIYPAERTRIPQALIELLLDRLLHEPRRPRPPLCRGTLLSRERYLDDIERGYRDARVLPFGNLSAGEIAEWTGAIPERGRPDSSAQR